MQTHLSLVLLDCPLPSLCSLLLAHCPISAASRVGGTIKIMALVSDAMRAILDTQGLDVREEKARGRYGKRPKFACAKACRDRSPHSVADLIISLADASCLGAHSSPGMLSSAHCLWLRSLTTRRAGRGATTASCARESSSAAPGASTRATAASHARQPR